jgi:hypothetical protein
MIDKLLAYNRIGGQWVRVAWDHLGYVLQLAMAIVGTSVAIVMSWFLLRTIIILFEYTVR